MTAPDDYFRRVMSGRATGLVPAVLRGVAGLAEPVYAAVVSARNGMYDRGSLASHALGRPAISVGNLSAGGTGKTPIVAFLARQLVAAGHRPAILLRGYKRAAGEKSDEQAELESLTARAGAWRVPVVVDADRVRGAAAALTERPEIDVFLLDDAFQHRRAKREMDVVLVSATQGLSGGHVLPRGLLREPPGSLARASVVVITRADQVLSNQLAELMREVGRLTKPGTPLYCCAHEPTDVTSSGGERLSPEAIRGQRLFAVTGTGDPEAFRRTLGSLGAEVGGVRVYSDHHRYTPGDRREIELLARAAGATAIVTTGKDAVKLLPLQGASAAPLPEYLPLLTLHVMPRFYDDGGERLMEAVRLRIGGAGR